MFSVSLQTVRWLYIAMYLIAMKHQSLQIIRNLTFYNLQTLTAHEHLYNLPY